MLFYILFLLVAGVIIGGIARLLVPGPDPMGCLGTALLGIAGSIVGGFLWNLFAYHSLYQRQLHPVGLIGSVIGAVVLLLVIRLFRGRRRHW